MANNWKLQQPAPPSLLCPPSGSALFYMSQNCHEDIKRWVELGHPNDGDDGDDDNKKGGGE